MVIGCNRCKKRKLNPNNGKIVSNSEQLEDFKMQAGKTWNDNFKSQCPKKCPDWNNKVKIGTGWHIKGYCYNTCPCAISHVPGNKIPCKQKQIFSPSWWTAGSALQTTRKNDSTGWSLAASDPLTNRLIKATYQQPCLSFLILMLSTSCYIYTTLQYGIIYIPTVSHKMSHC
jgi:hypothetical protein